MKSVFDFQKHLIITGKPQPSFPKPFLIIDTQTTKKPPKERNLIFIGSRSNIKGILKRSGLSIYRIGKRDKSFYFLGSSKISPIKTARKIKYIPTEHTLLIDKANSQFKLEGPRADNFWHDGKIIIIYTPTFPQEYIGKGRIIKRIRLND